MADASKSSEASKPGDASRAPLLRLGIAGLGTVGAGLIGLIEQQSARLSLTLGRHIRVTAVSAQSRAKNRGFSLEGKKWFDDPVKMAVDPEVDVFIELIRSRWRSTQRLTSSSS